jgi:hypothetical protein
MSDNQPIVVKFRQKGRMAVLAAGTVSDFVATKYTNPRSCQIQMSSLVLPQSDWEAVTRQFGNLSNANDNLLRVSLPRNKVERYWGCVIQSFGPTVSASSDTDELVVIDHLQIMAVGEDLVGKVQI